MDRTVRKRARKACALFYPKLLLVALLFFIPSLLQMAAFFAFPSLSRWSSWISAGLTILLFPICSMGAMAYGFELFQSGQTPPLSRLFRFAENKSSMRKGIVLGAAVTAPSLLGSLNVFFSGEAYSYIQVLSLPLMFFMIWLELRLFLAPYLYFRDTSLPVRECLSGSFRQMKGFCPNLFGFQVILGLPLALVLILAVMVMVFVNPQSLTSGAGMRILMFAWQLLYLLYSPYVLVATGGYACTVFPEEKKEKKK